MKSGVIFSITVLMFFVYQNCSEVGFSDGASGAGPAPAQITEGVDVVGGHFDLDTATEVYDDGDGETNKHVHEYDDKHKTNVANFFDLKDRGFDEIDETIDENEAFYIRVANGDLSPRVALEINGVAYGVNVKQHGPFSLNGKAGTTKLNSLRAIVATDAILNLGLVSTQTGCVRRNDFDAGGRYRNGALVFQAIPLDKINQVDAVLGVATDNEALFWEGLIFWHEKDGDCR